MKRILVVAVLFAGVWLASNRDVWLQSRAPAQSPASSAQSSTDNADAILAAAFENQKGNLQVRAQGTVRRILPDDNQGSRHQRFLLRLNSGQTVLIAHNIDLAPAIESLREGDTVAFFGEYEWNNKGGVIHWTHHDPQHRHVDGWLDHNGRRYQ